MQTDLDGNNSYGPVVAVERCGGAATGELTIFPNPSAGEFDLSFTGDKARVYSIVVFNSLGEKVFGSTGFLPAIDLTGKAAGAYYVQVHLAEEIINRRIILRAR